MKQMFKSPTTAVLTGVLIAGSALLLPPLPAKADAVNEIHAKAGDQASVSLTAYADSPFYKKLPMLRQRLTEGRPLLLHGILSRRWSSCGAC